MVKMTAGTMTRVLRVYRKCLELDSEHGTDLTEKFETAMRRVAGYADQFEEGSNNVVLSPQHPAEGGELEPKHFNFWCSLRRGVSTEESFGMMMFFHNGAKGLGDPVELSPEAGPHWSLHS